MGKLRVKSKVKTMDPEHYRKIYETLNEAHGLSSDAHVFYDLDPEEKATEVRKDFLYVANKEGIALKVRRIRGSESLKLIFGETPGGKASRLSPEESRRRILDVLSGAGEPMKKSSILAASGINRGAWNVRIRELIESGDVIREGERRDTVYMLKPKRRGRKKK